MQASSKAIRAKFGLRSNHLIHNKGVKKRYEKVAGCLIAFACRQSLIMGKEGYLAFDVLED